MGVFGADIFSAGQEFDLVTNQVPDYTRSEMRAKMFEVVLHLLPSGKSPVTALEEQINEFFLKQLQFLGGLCPDCVYREGVKAWASAVVKVSEKCQK
jgi:hypothetical protein